MVDKQTNEFPRKNLIRKLKLNFINDAVSKNIIPKVVPNSDF